EAGVDRVEEDIADRPQELALCLLQHRSEPVLEEVRGARLAAVGAKRMAGGEALGGLREPARRAADHEVPGGGHEGPGEAVELDLLRVSGEEGHELGVVDGLVEHPPPVATASEEVIRRTLKPNPKRPSHAVDRNGNSVRSHRLWMIWRTFDTNRG